MKRIHIDIPEQLLAQIDMVVGKRGRSAFLAELAEKEVMRLRQIQALKAATGAWKDKNHPELEQGAAKWVRSLRRGRPSPKRRSDRCG